MTSGNFEIIPVASIIVNREQRQRRELDNIEELAESIRERGLINPIVVTRDLELVAGERRLTAHQYLKFDSIAVQYAEDIGTDELYMIELEENTKRSDLNWQDKVRAVHTYHEMRKAADETWNRTSTAEALNIDRGLLVKYELVHAAMEEEVPEVLEAPKMSTAINFATRRQERKKAHISADVMGAIDGTAPEPDLDVTGDDTPAPLAPATRCAAILNTQFQPWAKDVQTEPYNLIHCDFPYGVNAGDTKGQSGAKHLGGYSDKPEDYFNLINDFLRLQDNFISPSAHLMFWFSMDFYTETKELFTQGGWRVNPFPLIWHKTDNAGILPDPNRGPRRTYETALLCTRGDRKVVKPVANSHGAPTTKKFHMSEKSEDMLHHFFRMLVDESTRMLDPTCGSGMAVKVAEAMGAETAVGLEMDSTFAESAKTNLGL